MPERLFLFIQLEFPWELGPPDGRYLLRSRETAGPPKPPGRASGETEAGWAGGIQHVVVLNTLGAPRRAGAGGGGIGAGRGTLTLPVLGPRRARRPRETTPDPTPVPISRATIIDPVSVSAERQAQAWLKELDAERETRAATAVLNRVLFAQRIATADPHTHALAPAQALVIRAGWGEGEQLADGYWQHALELPWVPSTRAQRRAAALRPQERLAELLGARTRELLCEELALRARLDLEEGRIALAAIELDAALGSAQGELGAEANPALAPRVDELRALRPGVGAVARAALPDAADMATTTDAPGAIGAEDSSEPSATPDEDLVRHALERLEAALRARTASRLTPRG
ncbi:MAG TPA: hypothetical protein VGL54_06365 [Solirubrobacteraceae bacterium]|jgi:hypothetical protein